MKPLKLCQKTFPGESIHTEISPLRFSGPLLEMFFDKGAEADPSKTQFFAALLYGTTVALIPQSTGEVRKLHRRTALR